MPIVNHGGNGLLMAKKFMTKSLLVFLRRPVLGKVKTRLAKELGKEKALEIYVWLLEVSRLSFESLNDEVHLYFDEKSHYLPDWAEKYSCYFQAGENLGGRMENAFLDHLSIKGENHCLMIGSDCPEMKESVILEAFDKINSSDLVLGPARDGGIYLIGMKSLKPGLLSNISWGSDKVFTQILNNAENLRISVNILPVLSDIDYATDFEKFEKQFEDYKEHNHVA